MLNQTIVGQRALISWSVFSSLSLNTSSSSLKGSCIHLHTIEGTQGAQNCGEQIDKHENTHTHTVDLSSSVRAACCNEGPFSFLFGSLSPSLSLLLLSRIRHLYLAGLYVIGSENQNSYLAAKRPTALDLQLFCHLVWIQLLEFVHQSTPG